MKKVMLCNAVLVALALSGCGGSSEGTASTGTATTSGGVITGFGSVYVNGVKYETHQARISRDGVEVPDDTHLAVGMFVTLRGTVNADGTTGTADVITYSDELEGVVLANGLASSGSLNVMGHEVIVTSTTMFESEISGIATALDLAPGHNVEVSGFADGNGKIIATRIEVKETADELEVKGIISGLDDSVKTFMLGSGLLVDYSEAEQLPLLSNGLYVEVKTDRVPTDNDGDGVYTLIAAEVELENDGKYGLQGDRDDEVKLQGVVTAVNTANGTFMLNGQTVRVGVGAFEDGLTLEALAELVGTSTPLKVEARFDANGNLVAEEIELGAQGEVEMEARVEAVDNVAQTLTLFGQTIRVTSITLMHDERGDQPEHRFSLSDLSVGDYVEVKAYRDGEGHLVAVKLERDDDDNQVKLDGRVTSLDPLAVEGVAVQLNTGLNLNLALDMPLEIEGYMNGSILVATQVELDD